MNKTNISVPVIVLLVSIVLLVVAFVSVPIVFPQFRPTPNASGVPSQTILTGTITDVYTATVSPTISPSTPVIPISTSTPILQTPTVAGPPSPTETQVVATPTVSGRVSLISPLDNQTFSKGCQGLTFEWSYPWDANFAIVFYHKTGTYYELVRDQGGMTRELKWVMSSSMPNGGYKWRIDVLDKNNKPVLLSEEKSFGCY